MLAIVCALAVAAAVAAPVEEPAQDDVLEALPDVEELAPAPVEVVDPAEVWRTMAPEVLLDQILAAIDQRDFAGAMGRLDVLEQTAGGPRIDYERGRVLELQEQWDAALAAYERAALVVVPGPLESDIQFRSALVLDDLGRSAEARSVLKKLAKSSALAEGAHAAIDLELGISDMRWGKTRRGNRKIGRALTELEGGTDHPWMQARARHAVLAAALEDAAELELEGNKKAARNLERRARAMKDAEAQITRIAELGELEYILAGLRDLGDAYLQLHDDFVAAPAPRRLTADQVGLYREQVDKRAAALPRKALGFYEMGLDLAVRRGWEGELLEDIRKRHIQVRAELESGSAG